MCAYVVHHVDVCFLDEEYDLLLVRVHVEPCQFSQIARVNPRCHAMISRWLARRIYHWNSLIISRDTSSINSRRIEDSIFHFLDDCPIPYRPCFRGRWRRATNATFVSGHVPSNIEKPLREIVKLRGEPFLWPFQYQLAVLIKNIEKRRKGKKKKLRETEFLISEFRASPKSGTDTVFMYVCKFVHLKKRKGKSINRHLKVYFPFEKTEVCGIQGWKIHA